MGHESFTGDDYDRSYEGTHLEAFLFLEKAFLLSVG